MIFKAEEMADAKPLFAGWEETMIRSCLQKVMGSIYAVDTKKADAAAAVLGDFTFLAGRPDRELVLYIPKVGALFGEAVVIPEKGRLPGFFTLMKQQGAVLAKGRLLGIQFDTLFTDNLYYRISKHAVDMAEKMKEILVSSGCRLWLDSPTNQQFVILNPQQKEMLAGRVSYEVWQELGGNNTAVRFCTSWATKEEDLEELKEVLRTS